LLSIVYPGTGNHSDFTYDGFGRNVKILEYTSSSLTNTKHFVWCNNDRCEARDASSTITAQYFALGETISGTSYFYTTDHLGLTAASVTPFVHLGLIDRYPDGFNPLDRPGSIREMTNTSGTIQSQYAYDPFGRVAKLQGSLSSDFQYAGYYNHAPSNLNLTPRRAYAANFGRWISRDPLGEAVPTIAATLARGNVSDSLRLKSSTDLNSLIPSLPIPGSANPTAIAGGFYSYVENEPTTRVDPSGLGSGICCGVRQHPETWFWGGWVVLLICAANDGLVAWNDELAGHKPQDTSTDPRFRFNQNGNDQ